MKWAKQGSWVAVSDSMPPYKVAKSIVDGVALYRASVRGEFIGRVCESAKAAQAICENHLAVMGADKEAA